MRARASGGIGPGEHQTSEGPFAVGAVSIRDRPTDVAARHVESLPSAPPRIPDGSTALFDEPTSALDPELAGEVLEAMRVLADSGMTVVVATHEIAFVREVGNEIAFMDQGVIVEVGTPDEVISRPRNERTRSFLSKVL